MARVFEEARIPTATLSACLDITRNVKPPRAAFIDVPYGHQCGKPFDVRMQTSVLKDALQTFYTITEPGTIVTLPYEEGDEDAWKEEYEPTVATA